MNLDRPEQPHVRQATPDDAALLLQLIRQTRTETPYLLLEADEGIATVAEQRCALASANDRIVLLAFLSAEPVGYLGATQGAFRRNRHCMSIAMAVLRRHWRRGIGRALLREAEDLAMRQGVTRMELTTLTRNAAALALYQSAGFSIEGTRRASLRIDGALHDEFFMAKLLDV